MSRYDALGLDRFLCRYRGMDVCPVNGVTLHIEGLFDFTAKSTDHDEITDAFRLRILVPDKFPRYIPLVDELDGRIPRWGAYHINPDGSLCLGSRLRLLATLASDPTLIGFAKNCLVPFLFAISRKLQQGGDFAFGELAHGSFGEIADYMNLFGLETVDQVKRTILYLGMKKRRAIDCRAHVGAVDGWVYAASIGELEDFGS
ncbi:MAG: hypothetical protein EWM72_00423 [Nitrospira sp.]|nr:MAG: hypothetical protein EWM72_00423 [Nitrospira sp.]